MTSQSEAIGFAIVFAKFTLLRNYTFSTMSSEMSGKTFV